MNATAEAIWTPSPTVLLTTKIGPLLLHAHGNADEYPPEADRDPEEAQRRRDRDPKRPEPFPVTDRLAIRTGRVEQIPGSADYVTINRVAYSVSAAVNLGPGPNDARIPEPYYILSRRDWTRYDDSHGSQSARDAAATAILTAIREWRQTPEAAEILLAGRVAALRRRLSHVDEARRRVRSQLLALDDLTTETLAAIDAALS